MLIQTNSKKIVNEILEAMKFELLFGDGSNGRVYTVLETVVRGALNEDESFAFFSDLKTWKEEKGL